MSELDPTVPSQGNSNGAAPTGPAFTVEKLYVKDVSFEAPGTPQVFNEAGQPQLQMNLNQRVQRLGDTAFEVVLGVTLTFVLVLACAQVAGLQIPPHRSPSCARSSPRWIRAAS